MDNRLSTDMGWNDLFGRNSTKGDAFPWKPLTDLAQLDGIFRDSATRPQLLFKHSTRCSISSMALQRFEREWDVNTPADIWCLDLLRHRDISDAIADRTGVMHQSPQAILLRNGEVTHHASHSGISAAAVSERAAS